MALRHNTLSLPLLVALLAVCLPPGVHGTCFFSELLGVSYCSSFSFSFNQQGPAPSPVFLGTPKPTMTPPADTTTTDNCICQTDVNPYCDASTGEQLGPNLSCTLCAGHDAKNIIPCIALGTVNQPETRTSLPCNCWEVDSPVCNSQTGAFLAKNGCLAVCDGAKLGTFALCSHTSSNAVTEAPTEASTTAPTPAPTPAPTQAPTPEPTQPPSPAQKACSDDPFHSGEVSGFAACTHLLSKCGSATTVATPSLQLPVQPLCSQEVQPACFDAAMDFAIRSPECFVFLTAGTDKCEAPVARAMFNKTVSALCSPA